MILDSSGEAVYLADASAWHRSNHAAVREGWQNAAQRQQLATCSIVRYELLFSTRGPGEFRRLQETLAALRDVPVTVSVQRAALAAMATLAEHGGHRHRVPLPDLLIAAAAQEAGLGVLHYDHHYDRARRGPGLREPLDRRARLPVAGARAPGRSRCGRPVRTLLTRVR